MWFFEKRGVMGKREPSGMRGGMGGGGSRVW